ncbi:unnamed protein product [Staurois parvus]|uniref:Uncharacterized protein n=1 Tax=Staurois parvus TaxID=386267 RepID=A0ABN9CYF6_9NEOB|nr:unnamed protein product [Staurois parvus]
MIGADPRSDNCRFSACALMISGAPSMPPASATYRCPSELPISATYQ